MTHQRNARVCAFLIAGVTAVGLAACGDDGDGSGEPTAGSTSGPSESSPSPVQLLVFGSPDELDAYRTLVAAYEEAEGGVVELVEASDREDLIARLSTSIAGGEPPDLFLMNYRFYGQFAATGAIEPLDELVNASDVIEPSDFYENAMTAFQWRGEQLCLPQNVSSLLVYYNRELFEQYDVPVPVDDWNWNDLITTARAMTRDANGAIVQGTETEGGVSTVEVYGLGVDPQMIRVAPFVWSNGGEIVDDQAAPTQFTLDTPEAREALKNFFDLRLAYGVIPTDEEAEAEDGETRFLNGRLAMFMDSRRLTTSLRASAGFDWDVARLPSYDEQVTILHADAYCMTSDSTNQEDAWRFLEYAESEEGQRVIAETGRTVPSNIAVSLSDAFLDPDQPPSNAQAWLGAIETIRSVPTISTWPEIEDITNGLLENGLYRGDPLDQVIAAIDEQTRPVFARGEHAGE